MKKLKLALNLIIILAIQASCSKNEDTPNTIIKSQNASKTERLLSIDPIKLGQEHNNVLKKISILASLKKSTSYSSNEIYSDLMATDLGLETEIKKNIYKYVKNNNDVEKNTISVSNELTSTGAKELYIKINNQLELCNNYNSIKNLLISNLAIIEKSNYNEYDKQIFRIFLRTCESSSYYWYIENRSITNTNKFSNRNMPNWVRKDGNGIAQASVGWAVTAALFGGGPATYFVALAVGGALSSIWPMAIPQNPLEVDQTREDLELPLDTIVKI